jgi:hypothetical protein
MRFWLAIAFTGICLAQSQPPPQAPSKTGQVKRNIHADENSKRNTDDKHAPKSGASINQNKPDSSSAQKDSKGDQISDGSPLSNLLLVIFTGVLAILAILQFWAMHRQAEYMRRGLQISVKQARIANRSALAAKASAEIAAQSAKLAEDTLHLTERADILVEWVRLSDPKSIPHSRVVISLKNFGRTRADKVLYKFLYGVPDVGVPETGEAVETNLGAGGEMKLYSSKTIHSALEGIEPGLYGRVIQSDVVFKVWGEAVFTDVFGDTHALRYSASLDTIAHGFRIEENQTKDSSSDAGET